LCTRGGLCEACDLTRDFYGDAYVADDVAEQWRLRNPHAFVQIMNAENRLCACFGILAVRDSFMDQFIAGRVTDHQLRGEDVLGWQESKGAGRLYLSGVVVAEPGSPKGHRRAAVMFWAMLEYLRQLYGLSMPRQLFAVAVTDDSRRVMKNLGFVVETPASQRADKHDLYRYDVTESSWNRLLCVVNDWSRLCTLDLELRESDAHHNGAVRPEPAPGLSIVFVAGDRGGAQRNQVQIPREFTSIQEAVRGSDYRDTFQIVPPVLGATRQMLVEIYRQRPGILHFAGHGDERSLSFVLDQGALVSQANVAAEQLATIVGSFPDLVRLCVLNTCDSAPVAEHLTRVGAVDAAIGWPAKVADDVAIAFSRALYGALGNGLPLARAVALATQSVAGAAPLLYTRDGVDRDEIYATPRTSQ
jgi:hypothetical protein